jgi:hypothetical protein
MAPQRRFSMANVHVELVEQRTESWKFQDRSVRGTAYTYDVKDNNFKRPARWTFVVRVPEAMGRQGYIEVRPTHCPRQRVFAGLDRRSVNFRAATQPRYSGHVYAKLFIGDVSGGKNKKGVRKGERTALPEYISRTSLRLKGTVASTRGTDANALVFIVKPTSHRTMIRFYLAARAWVLADQFVLA